MKPGSIQSRLTLNLAGLNVITDRLGTPTINLATSAESGTQDLLDRTPQVLGHGLEAHFAGDLDDLIERDGLGVLDVLLLLTVPRGLLEGFDDERGGRGDDGDGGLTVLDGQADGDAEAFLDIC